MQFYLVIFKVVPNRCAALFQLMILNKTGADNLFLKYHILGIASQVLKL